MKTLLVGIRRPTISERKNHDLPDAVFIRENIATGKKLKIYAVHGTKYTGWEQWGQNKEILSENVDDIEIWETNHYAMMGMRY